MTNIWKDSFEEVRKPFFEMEDPYTSLEEKKASKDYDGDGTVESGAKEYRGVIHNAIQKKKGGKPDGQDTSSVKEDVEEVGEEMKPLPKPKMFRKAANLGRDIVSPSTGDEDRQKKYDRSKKIIKQLNKANEETLVEVDKAKDHNGKVDIMKGGQKNTVVVNPDMKEQVEAWVGELVEEGYDLSQFTWDEMLEIYESAEVEQLDEAGTSDMPPSGDAQTATTSNNRMLTAKRRAAQAQIRADMARVQLQRVSTAESFDSIVEYLSQRPNAFENLEEGVFDPKKSKMRPASQRSQRTMTAAQRTAAKKEAQRTAEIHSRGETVLAGMRPQGPKGKVKTTPTPKSPAPAANRKVKGRKDTLASAADKVLKDLQK